MKKKVCALTLFASMLLLGHCNDVQAAEIKASDVANNTYIIGTHMFTDEVVLTTKHIMLGATTIKSDRLSDMTIYYKTPRGAWIDGLSGETVTIPTNFDVDYIDTVLQIETPVISSSEEISDTDDLHGKKYNLVLDKIENMTGVELYSSSTENGEYTLLKDYKIEEINNNSIEIEVKGGYNYYYKVKTYKTVSDKKYSEFSNVINIDNSLLQPSGSNGNGGYIPEEGEDQTHNRTLVFSEDAFETALGNNPDGIEVYFSLDKDGDYTLLRKIAYEDLLAEDVAGNGYLKFSFATTVGYVNYFKIRSYIEYSDETVYSEYKIVSYNAKLTAPTIYRLQKLAANEDNLTYGADIYLGGAPEEWQRTNPVGIDVLYSIEENGEYEILTSVALNEMTSYDNRYDSKY